MAYAVARAAVMFNDADMREPNVDPAEIDRRALIKMDLDPRVKMALTLAVNEIQAMAAKVVDDRVRELLQPGVTTYDEAGYMVEVERREDKLSVTSLLTGAGLDISDGAFVIFIDTRIASGSALKRFEDRAKDDTRLVMIPIDPPEGQTVSDCVAAKRQDESGFAV